MDELTSSSPYLACCGRWELELKAIKSPDCSCARFGDLLLWTSFALGPLGWGGAGGTERKFSGLVHPSPSKNLVLEGGLNSMKRPQHGASP